MAAMGMPHTLFVGLTVMELVLLLVLVALAWEAQWRAPSQESERIDQISGESADCPTSGEDKSGAR